MDRETEILNQIDEHRKKMFELGAELNEITFTKRGFEKLSEEEVLERLNRGEVLKTPNENYYLVVDGKPRKLNIETREDSLQINLYRSLSLDYVNFVKPAKNPDIIRFIVSIKDLEL